MSNKVRKLTVYKKPGVHDYSLAAARIRSASNGDTNHVISDVKEGVGIVKSIFGKKKYPPDVQRFYDERDRVYQLINSVHGNKHYEKVPGNPFSEFAHKYKRNEGYLSRFYQVVEQYYPGLLAGQPGAATAQPSVIKPLNQVMDMGILSAGGVPPMSTSVKTKEFVETVVAPATGQDYGNVAGEVLESAAIDFIATLVQRKKNGEQLPPAYDKLATAAMKVEEKVENKVKQAAAGKIGGFVVDNGILILGGIAVVLLLSRKS